MTMDGLVDYLKDIGPYDEPRTPDTEDDTLSPPPEEDTKDDESVGENELRDNEDELEAEPIAEGTLEENLQLSMNPRKTNGVRNPQLRMNPKRIQWRKKTLRKIQRKTPLRNL